MQSKLASEVTSRHLGTNDKAEQLSLSTRQLWTKVRDVQDCQQMLGSAFDLLLIFVL